MPSDESKGSQLDAIGSLAQRQLDNTEGGPTNSSSPRWKFCTLSPPGHRRNNVLEKERLVRLSSEARHRVWEGMVRAMNVVSPDCNSHAIRSRVGEDVPLTAVSENPNTPGVWYR